MLLVSFIVMHVTMYANTEQFSHIYLSTNRLYMTTLMISTMAVIMLLFMPSMYPNKKTNALIIGGAIALFLGTFAIIRHQTFIDDRRFMESMIPHHSIAILVSKNASLKDPQVKALANSIIRAQEREIAEMKQMLKRVK